MQDEFSKNTEVETLFDLVLNEELSNASSLEELKKSVKEKLETLIADMQNCTDYEALQEFKKGISAKQCLLRPIIENPKCQHRLRKGCDYHTTKKLKHRNVFTQQRRKESDVGE